MKDLLKLYSFESIIGSADEAAIADWICKWLDAHNITGYERQSNNIYYFGGNCDGLILSAHLDQVRTNGKAVHFYQDDDGFITAYNKDWERTSLGADDKNGVWLILKTLEAGYNVNFIISEGEEAGCVGIKSLEYQGVLENRITADNFCIVLDRRGEGDVLTGGSCCTFCNTLADNIINFLRDPLMVKTTGSLSDTCTLCEYCESVNMSVAYYKPHTAEEYTDFNRLEEIKEHVIAIADYFVHYPSPPETYLSKTTTTKFNKYNNYYDNYSRGRMYDDEWYY